MNINSKLYKFQFNKAQQIRLLTQLSHLVDAGVPAPDALQYMYKIALEKKDKVFTMILGKMCKNASEGKKIAENMSEWFPHEICIILIKSEERGFLADGIKNILDYLNSNKIFFSPLAKMISGLMYLLMALIAITVIGYIYLPKIGQHSLNWPPISMALYKFSGFFYHYYLLVLIVIAAAIFWIFWSIRNYKGKFYQCTAIPFMMIYRARLSYFIFKVFALLSSNGVGVPEIIYQLNKTYTKGFLADRLQTMLIKVSSGEQNMGNAMDTGLFSKHHINELHLISRFVGEENYSKIFSAMANIISAQIIKIFTKISVVVNLVCLLLTGASILWIYGAYALLASSIN